MGLDMYLQKRDKVICPHCGKEIVGAGESEELIYWRKANAIHGWFEKHCANGCIENCKEYIVTKDQLIELRNDCEKVVTHSMFVRKTVKESQYDFITKECKEVDVVKEVLKDQSFAQELLPTHRGFFHGETTYDKTYINELLFTIDQIDKILKETDFEHSEITYYAWW